MIVPGQIRALIVDDNAYARAMTAAMLRTLGIADAANADSGAEAIALLSSERFDVMLTDWYMPDISGAGLLKVVRDPRFGRAQGLPIIMMTGYASRETFAEARTLGANEVLSKPFTADHLLMALGRVLKADWGLAGVAETGAAPAEQEDDTFFL